MHAIRQGTLVDSTQGKHVALGGLELVFKITGKDAGDAVSVLEATIEPGRLVPPHMHENEDEDSYVLEAEIGVRVGDQEFQAAAGSYVLKPRGIPHTFWNTGTTPPSRSRTGVYLLS